MKNAILTSVLLLLQMTVIAQVKNNEIGISIGLAPGFESTAYEKLDQRIARIAGAEFDGLDAVVSTSFHVDYLRRLSRRLSVGAVAGYSAFSSMESADVEYEGPHSITYFRNSEDRKYYLAPQARWIWAQSEHEHFRFYARAMAGLSVEHAEMEIDNSVYSTTRLGFAFQISPLGIDWGGDHFRGFVETGVGHQGMFICGVRGCF